MTLDDRHVESRRFACKELRKAQFRIAFVRRLIKGSQIESEGVIRADLQAAEDLIHQAASRMQPPTSRARKSKTAGVDSPALDASS